MNKKFKNRNRGLVTFGIVALSAVALTASGFAAWVINVSDSKTAGGNIQVDTVESNNHTLTVTLSKDNIVFGSVSGGKARYESDTDVPSVMESNEKPACRRMEIPCDLDPNTSVVLNVYRGRNVFPKVFVRTF